MNRLARGEFMHISEKEQQVNPALGIPRTPGAQHGGEMVKSPSDTTLYKPAMKKGVESELVNRISNFVENIRIETAASPNVAKHSQAHPVRLISYLAHPTKLRQVNMVKIHNDVDCQTKTRIPIGFYYKLNVSRRICQHHQVMPLMIVNKMMISFMLHVILTVI